MAGVPAAAVALHTLRPRERQVADLVAADLTNAEIAERLHISVRTVESHVYRATTRLGLRSRDELARLVRAGGSPRP
jgi:DNA-binding CsgD family transcriptional regulator